MEQVTRGGSLEARAVVIAPDGVEIRSHQPQNEVRGKGKGELVEQRETKSDRDELLNVTWSNSEEEE